MGNISRWKRQYTKDVDVKDLNWIKLNSEELEEFLKENYLDKTVWEYVHDETADHAFPTILGMTFLSFNEPLFNNHNQYLLGIANNRIGKKTIVAATTYLEDYMLYRHQLKPATYISTMEVNTHFRRKGVFKEMCKALSSIVKKDQHIITTQETNMGKQCHTFDTLKRTLEENGFQKLIIVDDCLRVHRDYYDDFCSEKVYEKKD